MSISDKQTEYLYARLDDLAEAQEKGIFRSSEFYSPAELVFVRRWISARAKSTSTRIWGGYAHAERARVYFLPEYMGIPENDIGSFLSEYGYDDPTEVLRIEGSGFRVLSHRDFMGSVLSLGIERSVIGDIVADTDNSAYVFCDSAISGYICDNLKKAANDAVAVYKTALPEGNFGEKKYREIRDTVASMRFDCIVASACGLSRENAKRTVLGGSCELNHELITSPDRELEAGDVFSIRGQGKYAIAAINGENARGRQRIVIHKYL